MPLLPGLRFFRTLADRRTLLFQLVRRDFEQRFVGSAAGWLWGLIQPLVLLLSWTFVFQVCLKMELPRDAITRNYTMFLFAGYLPWLLFQETVTRSATSLLDHSNLITKTVFPAEVIPVSVFLSSLVSHLMTLTLAVIAAFLWLNHFSVMIFLLPLYMLFTGLFAVGIGWVVASLQVYLRDTAQVMIVVLTLWFWVTPIFITEEQYPAGVQWVLKVNPLAHLVRAYRERLLSYRLPAAEELMILTICSVAAFVVGGLIFRHLKRGFADVL
ncbi:MAG: ABC transporter permease [Acidobacteria bacterium]|nr:ABC transporter permease [Acidobacteriota bacterium]